MASSMALPVYIRNQLNTYGNEIIQQITGIAIKLTEKVCETFQTFRIAERTDTNIHGRGGLVTVNKQLEFIENLGHKALARIIIKKNDESITSRAKRKVEIPGIRGRFHFFDLERERSNCERREGMEGLTDFIGVGIADEEDFEGVWKDDPTVTSLVRAGLEDLDVYFCAGLEDSDVFFSPSRHGSAAGKDSGLVSSLLLFPREMCLVLFNRVIDWSEDLYNAPESPTLRGKKKNMWKRSTSLSTPVPCLSENSRA